MGWNMKLLGGEILREKSGREQQDNEKEQEGEEKYETYCQIKVKHRRGVSWCSDVLDCGDCWYFKKYGPDVKWICCRCLRQLESMLDFKPPVLDYYHSGQCALCKEPGIALMPVVMRGEYD